MTIIEGKIRGMRMAMIHDWPPHPTGLFKPPGRLDRLPATNEATDPDNSLKTRVSPNKASHPKHEASLATVHTSALAQLRPVQPRLEAVPCSRRRATAHQPGAQATAAGCEAVLGALPGSERGSPRTTSSPSQSASNSELQPGTNLTARQPSEPAAPSEQCQDAAAQEMETFLRPGQERGAY